MANPTGKGGSKPKPITLGEPIPDTHLTRRFQGSREIAPVYTGRERLRSLAIDEATEQAERIGYRSVEVWGNTYVSISGEWYVWG